MVLAEKNNKQDLGLALLGIGSSFGIWSSLNTSPVGTVAFANSNPKVATTGMNISLAIILAMAGGIALYYKKRGYLAAATTAASGIGLWLWYNNLMKKYTVIIPTQENSDSNVSIF